MSKKRTILELLICSLWIFAAVFGVNCFNRYVLIGLPLVGRMVSIILVYLCVAVVPLIIALIGKEKWSDYGFTKEKIGFQIIIGLLIGVVMSIVLTLPFHLFGLGDWVNNGKHYTVWWQFLYEILYCVVAVGFTEEFIFRGFLYKKVSDLSDNKVLPVVLSSVMFGLFHIFGGSWVQIFSTAALGVLWCFLRLKIKNCSTLSLIIAHGIYDFLITVWVAVFL